MPPGLVHLEGSWFCQVFSKKLCACDKVKVKLNEGTALGAHLQSFKENIDALCDGDDRGQGFLVRQLMGLAAERGPRKPAAGGSYA